MSKKKFGLDLASAVDALRDLQRAPAKRRRTAVNPAPLRTNQIPKVILNPAWEGSEEQKDEAMALSWTLDDFHALCPDESHRIPEKGAWVMVKLPPACEYTVPPFSMWYAFAELRPKSEGQAYHLARIMTPKGDLYLWPHEYVVVKDIGVYFEFPDKDIHINLMGGTGGIDPDKLFYIRSRGISKADAIKMLLGEVTTQDVAYITVHPAYGRCFLRENQWPETSRLAVLENWPGEPEQVPA